MMAKKVGNLVDIFKPDLYKYILIGVFDDVMLGGTSSYKEVQEYFKITIQKDINTIMLQTVDDNKFKIELSKKTNTRKDAFLSGFLMTKSTFIIHYDKPNFPIYDSEY